MRSLDKHDRELIDFALSHGCKDLDEAKFALEKFKAQEAEKAAKLENEQEEQRKKHAEEEDNVRRAAETKRNLVLVKVFGLERHYCPVRVTIDGKHALFNRKLGGYECPYCNGKLTDSILEKALRIGIEVFPGLLREPPDCTPVIDGVNKLTTWQNEVKCPTCAKELMVKIQPTP